MENRTKLQSAPASAGQEIPELQCETKLRSWMNDEKFHEFAIKNFAVPADPQELETFKKEVVQMWKEVQDQANRSGIELKKGRKIASAFLVI